jgi:hypothetical protein
MAVAFSVQLITEKKLKCRVLIGIEFMDQKSQITAKTEIILLVVKKKERV